MQVNRGLLCGSIDVWGSGSLPRDGWEKMYYAIMADNDRFGELPVERRYASLRTDPYWNALQVKYAYACSTVTMSPLATNSIPRGLAPVK